jgi:hypothetical protein
MRPGTGSGKIRFSVGRTREHLVNRNELYFYIAAKRHTYEVALRRGDAARAPDERIRRAPLLERVCPRITAAARRKLGARGNPIGCPHQSNILIFSLVKILKQ